MARASHELGIPSDYEGTLRAIAARSLPHLGSWSIVDLVDPSGLVTRVSVIHSDPGKQVFAERLKAGWPPERDDPMGAPRAVASRRTEVVSEVPDSMLVKVARNEENLRNLRALGIRSIVTVPMIVRDKVVGAITFVNARAGRRFTDDEIATAEDLASLCALALENARLLAEARKHRETAMLMNEKLLLSALREQDLAERAGVATEARSRFLAHMSHEIRTPIQAMLGYTQLLQSGLAGAVTPEQKEFLERIRSGGQHLTDLVADVLDMSKDVLDMSKLEAGAVRVETHPLPVRTVVADAVGMLQAMASQALLDIEIFPTDASFEDTLVLGDEDRVRQILLNLLSNAVKFTDPGGRVAVTWGRAAEAGREALASPEGSWVFIEVEDSGIGIPRTERETIFTPFVQGTKSGDRARAPGTGLGLAISRDLAHLMGGEITFWSEEGEGSRFILWLPSPSGEYDRRAAEQRREEMERREPPTPPR